MPPPSTAPVEPSLVVAPPEWEKLDPSDFRVLLADDNRNLRAVLKKALANEGYSVEVLHDGLELLERAREAPPDLAVLDVMMPRLNGLSAVSEIRRDPTLATTYVILLTARSNLEEKIEGLDGGADDYLTKPFQLAELLARVRAGLRIKSMQRSLAASQQMVIRREKLATIGQLASGIAHEFNNIMSAISGFAQLARQNEKFRERLVIVALEQSQRAQQITSSLSSFSSNANLGTRRTSVDHLVNSSVCLVEKKLSQREIRLAVKLANELAPIDVDLGQMQQALLNILLNAIHATPAQGRIELRAYTTPRTVRLEVHDSGPGVPEEIRHRVFDPFFTTKGALGSSEVPGTGLGLSFSLNIVQRHHGTIHLTASDLGGACFRIELPSAADDGDQKPGKGTTQILARSGGSVVLIEDDPTIQEVVQEVVTGPLEIFAEGPQGVAYCRDHEVEAVILDLTLAGPWDGERVLRELCQFDSPPPVIVTSGSIDSTDAIKAMPATVAILTKPYELSELEEALKLALMRQKLSSEKP